MTTPSGNVAYPTLFVPPPGQPLATEDSSAPTPTSKSNTDQPNMNTEQQKDAGWFTSFSTGQTPSGDNPATPGAFNAQSAASWLAQRYHPWSEFFNTKKFGLPKLDVAFQRIQHNLGYFLSNYLCIGVVLLIYCVITSIVLLLSLLALGGLCYSIRQRTLRGPVVIGGQELPPLLLYTVALIITIPLFFLADASGVIGWVIGTSIFLIILHAALYSSEPVPGEEFEVVTVA
ncbi:PRA1 family protein [Aphelenchoides bicaudatus]|nr:PRA1 family protein [Aphelenchoides bicaudatus]